MNQQITFALNLLVEYPDARITLEQRETEFEDDADEDGAREYAAIPRCECCDGPGSRHYEPSDGSVGYGGWDYTPRVEVWSDIREAEFDVCDECGEQIIAAISKVRGLFGEKAEAAE